MKTKYVLKVYHMETKCQGFPGEICYLIIDAPQEAPTGDPILPGVAPPALTRLLRLRLDHVVKDLLLKAVPDLRELYACQEVTLLK